mmetsp:Transcript_93260/g.290165  ORF Transcript_93260/g.290165 Transcript_93260/m.290165 type:complete len:219 (-) Transcript_93260:204-860(-)
MGSLAVLRADEDAAGALVQPVHEERRRRAVRWPQVADELAHQRLADEAVHRRRPQGRRLRDNEEVLVLVQDCQAAGVVRDQRDGLPRPLDEAVHQPPVAGVAPPQQLAHLLGRAPLPAAVHAEAEPQHGPERLVRHGLDRPRGALLDLLIAYGVVGAQLPLQGALLPVQVAQELRAAGAQVLPDVQSPRHLAAARADPAVVFLLAVSIFPVFWILLLK